MPTPKKPAAPAVETVSLEEQREAGARNEREQRASRWSITQDFLEDIQKTDIDILEAAMRISRREAGLNTPIEAFIRNLLHAYMSCDDHGEGLTLEAIESEMDELRRWYPSSITDAHFMASRYALPEVTDAQ